MEYPQAPTTDHGHPDADMSLSSHADYNKFTALDLSPLLTLTHFALFFAICLCVGTCFIFRNVYWCFTMCIIWLSVIFVNIFQRRLPRSDRGVGRWRCDCRCRVFWLFFLKSSTQPRVGVDPLETASIRTNSRPLEHEEGWTLTAPHTSLSLATNHRMLKSCCTSPAVAVALLHVTSCHSHGLPHVSLKTRKLLPPSEEHIVPRGLWDRERVCVCVPPPEWRNIEVRWLSGQDFVTNGYPGFSFQLEHAVL